MDSTQHNKLIGRHDKHVRSRLRYYARLLWAWSMRAGEAAGCHQLPERSFHLFGYQFPICARCTGTHVGELLCVVGFFAFGLLLPVGAGIALAALMLFDWLANQFDLYSGNNAWRFFTGVLGGFGCWSVLLHVGIWVVGMLS